MTTQKSSAYTAKADRLRRDLLQSAIDINDELKRDKVRVTIRAKNNENLIVTYTDPSGKRKEISPPGVQLNRSGLEYARKVAHQIRSAIDGGEYSDEWLDTHLYRKGDRAKNRLTWGVMMNGWESEWLKSRAGSDTTQRQINRTLSGYREQLKLVGSVEPSTEFNPRLVTLLLDQQAEGTHKRFRLREILSILCRLYKIPYDFTGIGKRPKPLRRDIPTDDRIVEMFASFPAIGNSRQADGNLIPAYQWYFGMLATYGLRPQELFAVDMVKSFKAETAYWVYLDAGLCDGLKTGSRWIPPLHNCWVDLFDLANPKTISNLRGSENVEDWSRCVSSYFNKHKIGCRPYDLRHAYAIRCRKAGLSLSDSADAMGHETQTHTKQYQRWISIDDRIESVRNALDRHK